jgi:TonB family protein
MVSAIVELEVVLRKDGTIGNIEITHWGGFGLDESAIEAVKGLKFMPATLDNQLVSCRAVLRYNFNYKTQSDLTKKP